MASHQQTCVPETSLPFEEHDVPLPVPVASNTCNSPEASAVDVCCSTDSTDHNGFCSQLKENMAEANTSGFDRLFQRMKSDLMYELRNIQHGERPVTGQGNRENIEQFLTKHFPTSDADTNSKGNLPSTVQNAEEHRPESVVVEVQGIIERRPVSSILQSAAFRRQLENVIRGSIGTSQRPRGRNSPVARRDNTSTVNVPEFVPPVPRPRSTAIAASSHSTEPSSVTQTWTTGPPLPLMRQASSESISSLDSFSSARSSADLDEEIDDVDVAQSSDINEPPISRPVIERPIPHPRQSENAETRQDTGFENLSWSDIGQVHRQELVEEISELLHSRLVSSTLDGEFRATLELLVQDRVSSSGTNGQAVENFIRNLPASGVPRNDFTDLGIPPAQDLDNLDNVSVTNISAHSVPYTQTNTHLSREIQGLKSQMMEMKNMLKLTFDLQMDIQRAIRQEVAAAMSQFAEQGASGGAAAVPVSTKPVNDTHCLICLERHSDCVLYQCGHMCVCYVCGRDLVSRSLGCPVCRAPIKDVIRAYKTNVD
ncbi:uncharacterized protein LOC101846543 isoform X2 [Aplysia californica]|uniref:Uncharacterized protein LOC101846543 isoform X2 n=1 Tax=Aplysia californica TaxID=6500 RepID=A0ABM1VP46_APLCA|nr:uncharacterized protein LOC101846543 isoform X2 [Aplysia californica]